MLNRKLLFSFINYKGNRYIILEPKKFIKNTVKWENRAKVFIFPREILKDNQNRKITNKINIKK